MFAYVLAGIMVFVIPCLCHAEPSLEAIKAGFKKKDLEERLTALESLEGRRDEETVDFLMAVAGNGWEDWRVKIRAIQLLGKAGNPRAVDLLLMIFATDSQHYACPAVKTQTAAALGYFRDDDRVTDILIMGIQGDEPQVREAAVQSLGKVADARVLPYLIYLLNDDSIAVRLSAIQALAGISDPQVVSYLEILSTKDSDEVVRNVARNALSSRGDSGGE